MQKFHLSQIFMRLYALPQAVVAAGRAVVDIVLPHHCPSCGQLGQGIGLCAACWGQLQHNHHACPRCALPLPDGVGAGYCASCAASPPVFSAARTAWRYGDGCRQMILALKYGDDSRALGLMARELQLAGKDIVAAADWLVPVPLHWRRYLARRYNQAELLADHLAPLLGIKVVRALERQRFDRSQGGLNPSRRAKNVRGAFRASPKLYPQIKGKTIILLDDVMTTGATANEAAATLLAAGAAEIRVLALARADQLR